MLTMKQNKSCFILTANKLLKSYGMIIQQIVMNIIPLLHNPNLQITYIHAVDTPWTVSLACETSSPTFMEYSAVSDILVWYIVNICVVPTVDGSILISGTIGSLFLYHVTGTLGFDTSQLSVPVLDSVTVMSFNGDVIRIGDSAIWNYMCDKHGRI